LSGTFIISKLLFQLQFKILFKNDLKLIAKMSGLEELNGEVRKVLKKRKLGNPNKRSAFLAQLTFVSIVSGDF
jgi:hypothetical protein